MRRAAILCFSDRGVETAARAAAALAGEWECETHRPHGNLKELTARLFPSVDALLFVGACGIAVRAVAPHVVSKVSDPAVLVADEKGEFVISLLSGHIGGANDLARQVAAALGGTAVITTATDVNHRFSADAWAAKRGLAIDDMEAAKRFSAAILRRDLPLWTDLPVEGALPPGVFRGEEGETGLAVSCRRIRPFADTLLLALHLGIGCRRGVSVEQIEAAVRAALEAAGFHPQSVAAAATIDVKRDEPGLLAWAEEKGLVLSFHTAAELASVPGEFTASQFVQKTVGVDNVCERAAMLSAGAGASLVIGKTALNGVTVAAAQEDWRVSFA